MRVESVAPSSFLAARQTRRTADPVGIAACLAHRDFDLTGEGQIARVDARSPTAGTAWSDAEIISVITRHDKTIEIGFDPRKAFQALVVPWRNKTCRSVETAEAATSHILTATHFSFENKGENTPSDTTAPCGVP